MGKKIILFFFSYFLWLNIYSQDIQFSQYYNLPQLMNPSMVGTSYAFRGIAHARLQWPALDAKYTSYFASADYNWRKYNSGIGAYFLNDKQGNPYITSNTAAIQYAYWVNLSKKVSIRSGVQFAYNRRSLDYYKLNFPNQFTGSGFDTHIPTNDDQAKLSRGYMDISSGLILYTSNLWAGISGFHLNRPNQSLIGQLDRLPARYDFVAGYKIVLEKNQTMRYLEAHDEEVLSVTPTFQYKFQGKSDQLDLGVYLIYKFLLAGIWYRGIPIKNYNTTLINNESLIFITGLKYDNFSISYSYDAVISKLHNYARGAHEINLTYLYPKRKNFNPKNVKFKPLPCPHFMNK